MNCLRYALLLGGLLWSYFLSAQSTPLAEFTVYAGEYDRLNTPVTVYEDDLRLSLSSADSLQLIELRNNDSLTVPVQWMAGEPSGLTWILAGETPARSTRRFRLRKVQSSPSSSPAVAVSDQDSAVTFSRGKQKILTYQYTPAEVPPGVDPIFRRGGFIHPLRSPSGAVLTRIQPPDHYHHYGIWNPWTRTEFAGREIDFWNLAKGQGTVASRGVTSVTGGPVFGSLSAWHEHMTFADSANRSTAQKLLNEVWDLRVWNSDSKQSSYLVDFVSTQSNVTDQPFTVTKYRYQGFGFRATADWNDRTAHLLTSSGKTKADGNATRARWIDVRGPVPGGTAGILFMTHPTNFNFPELLRIWPEGANEGVENVFVNFNPTQDRNWVMPPNQTYALKYRMLVYNGQLDSATAERYWHDYAYPPRVEVHRSTALNGKKILLYTKNGEGYVHDNIPASVRAIQQLADKNGFTVVASDDPAQFTSDNLAQYDALVFSNTNNDVFDTPEQHQAFQDYMQSGGRFVGIHSACGSERDWPWFWHNLGGKFVRHARLQDFEVKVTDPSHPSTEFLPATWSIEDDECYYLNQLNPNIRVLVAADLSTVEDKKKAEYPGEIYGNSFPTTWCHTTDGGRQWYTSLGHRSEHYGDPVFMRHILGGIQWVMEE